MAKKKPTAEKEDPAKAVTESAPKPKKAAAKAAPGEIFRLKITLNHIDPPIWRRVETRDCTLALLHEIIQISMGWEDEHLHMFDLGGRRYAGPDEDDEDEGEIKLSEVFGPKVKKIRYEYDMGDSWKHTIALEKKVAVEAGAHYPRCTAGERACPPEDCGGPYGYADFVEAVTDPTHEDHEDRLEWIGEFDPEHFDPEPANAMLKDLE